MENYETLYLKVQENARKMLARELGEKYGVKEGSSLGEFQDAYAKKKKSFYKEDNMDFRGELITGLKEQEFEDALKILNPKFKETVIEELKEKFEPKPEIEQKPSICKPIKPSGR